MDDRFLDSDPSAPDRKLDHISLAFQSRIDQKDIDDRFYYEPMLSGHPDKQTAIGKKFLGKNFDMPVWVSSMTGGTEKASTINKNLARACREFGMGMGLGSCRQLLTDDTYLPDFQVRSLIGDQPLYANLGIAQIIQLINAQKVNLIVELMSKLETDGLIVHINPLQEWLQPEGDRYYESPLDVIKRLLDILPSHKIIVKEVGHGMGKKSLEALLELPLAAVDFAANGGTNFSLLELLRTSGSDAQEWQSLARVGHSALEMVQMINDFWKKNADRIVCKEIIISGGISDFLDGYYLVNKSKLSAVYGQASGFLKHAMGSYDELYAYVEQQKQGLLIANSFLTVK